MSPRPPTSIFALTAANLSPATPSGDGPERAHERLLLAAVIEEAQDAIFSNTLDGVVTSWNPAAERLFGYSAEEIVGMPNSLVVPPAHLLEDEILATQLYRGNVPASFETVRSHKSGELLRVTLTLSPIKNSLGEVVAVSTIARNTLEPPQIVQGLRQYGRIPETPPSGIDDPTVSVKTLPTSDSLTGLKNHRVFQEWLRDAIARATGDEAPISLVLLDIDRFKSYNDRFGHRAGDWVLQKMAAILKATARTTELVARYGGEEFAILLPETNVSGAKAIAERYRSAIEIAAWPSQAITASFGIATTDSGAFTAPALVMRAEEALARAKEHGRNSVAHADDLIIRKAEAEPEPALNSVVLRHLELLQTDSSASASEALKQSLMATYDATVETWSRVLDQRDKETEGHNRRVTALMERLAKHVGMDDDGVRFARWGAQLHDIGKMAVPDEILHKRGALSVEEWVEIRRHPVIAFEMLTPIVFLGSAIDIPYCHHERWDGTGYPRALRGSAIPFSARLFAVIDVYDSLCSDRSYRDGWPQNRVCEYLQRQAGAHFDPRAVDAFLNMLEQEEEITASPSPSRYVAFA